MAATRGSQETHRRPFTERSHTRKRRETARWKSRVATDRLTPATRCGGGRNPSMVYKAEYIWIDGTEPTAKLRSKTKIVADGADLPIWGFDGSSTNQAPGSQSDCVLQPVFSCPGPDPGRRQRPRDGRGALIDMSPHPTNTRAALRRDRRPVQGAGVAVRHRAGVHVLQGRPAPRLSRSAASPRPQGGYYCGVGADEVYGRDVVEAHLDACIDAGLHISGINAEVMPGQWEFQVGPRRPARGRRPAVDRPLAALPHRRGLRRRRHARPQAGEGRLERRRRAHQLLDQGDARVLRPDHHRRARRSAARPS